MTEQVSNLKIGLLDNGSHSLARGYEMWARWKKDGDPWLLKESVIWVHHGIELLLKQLVVQTNEFLVFQDVNKAVERLGILRKKVGMEHAGVLDLFDYDDKVMSVGFKNLIDRAAITLNINELSENEPLRNNIDKLTRTRNKIVHFSVEMDVVEIAGLLSGILNPLLSLLCQEVRDHEFKERTIPKIRKIAQPLHEYMEYVRSEIVKNAVQATEEAMPPLGNGKAGIISQVLGSGLTASLSSYLRLARFIGGISDKKIVILVDRQDQAHQVHEVMSRENDLKPVSPNSKSELSSLISSVNQEIIICTVQKIHSYGIKFGCGCLVVGYNIRAVPENLDGFFPSATYILFTSASRQLAPVFFGRVVSVYDYHQAINDCVSVPLKIKNVNLGLDVVLRLVNDSSRVAGDKGVISSKLLGLLAEKIVCHYEKNEPQSLRKSYVVVRDAKTADCLLNKILQIKPEWQDKVETERVVSSISSKARVEKRSFLLKSFSDEDDSLSLLIGTGELLVGYDNPLLSTVYLTCSVSHYIQYKLLSAVTRYQKNKQYGLIVDFAGLDWS